MPYTVRVVPVDASLVANREKFFPKEWINLEQNNVRPEAEAYFLPLIEGERVITMKNGLPVHYKLGKIFE